MAAYANGTNGLSSSHLQPSIEGPQPGANVGPGPDTAMVDLDPNGGAPPNGMGLADMDAFMTNSGLGPRANNLSSFPPRPALDTRLGPAPAPPPIDVDATSPAMPDSGGGGRPGSANPLTGAGAGPLPTGFGAPPGANGGSTLTEFTKRRNWSQRVLEELKDFLHILTPDGRILYASASAEALTGYRPEELVGRFIVDFVHADDSAIFVREFNESIASGNNLRFFHRFRKADGDYTIFESHGHAHLCAEPPPSATTANGASGGPAPGSGGGGGGGGASGASGSTNAGAGYCRGFFMMSRPYPTKNASLLDSFLEHKIENERLLRRIADLRREEREEEDAQARHYRDSQASFTPTDSRGGDDSLSPAETPGAGPSTGGTGGAAGGPPGDADSAAIMPPPAKPGGAGAGPAGPEAPGANAALTTQNLSEANAAFTPDSITDKMARYEGATHLETIEMLTGLRYRDGERAEGISTGAASPALIRGDAGIPVTADKDGRIGDKKKKLKVADEYVCTDCGTLDSPEWRKGPSGPKTLCNACGLRWAKKEKKRSGPGPSPTTAGPPSHFPSSVGAATNGS